MAAGPLRRRRRASSNAASCSSATTSDSRPVEARRCQKQVKLPRSEDVEKKEPKIHAGLCEAGFFEALAKTLGADPQSNCPGDFSKSEAVLSKKKFSAAKRRDAKLVFIRHGAYCDCQVIQSVQPELEKSSARGA